MENRTVEFQAMMDELAQPPKELKTSVERARRRARHTRMFRRFTAPIGTVASVAACFVLMVNLFPTAKVRDKNTTTTTGTDSMDVPFPFSTLYPHPRKEAAAAVMHTSG